MGGLEPIEFSGVLSSEGTPFLWCFGGLQEFCSRSGGYEIGEFASPGYSAGGKCKKTDIGRLSRYRSSVGKLIENQFDLWSWRLFNLYNHRCSLFIKSLLINRLIQ